MTVKEAHNRGNNLASSIIVVLAGFAFLPETILETEIPYKIDDIFLFLLGIGTIIWYKSKNHKFTHSIVPLLFSLAGLFTKIGAVILEIKDKEDVGDDFGALILFILASLFAFWLYKKSAEIKD